MLVLFEPGRAAVTCGSWKADYPQRGSGGQSTNRRAAIRPAAGPSGRSPSCRSPRPRCHAMADARTSGSRSSPAALDGVPDKVALDQLFRTGDLFLLRAAVAAHASALGGRPSRWTRWSSSPANWPPTRSCTVAGTAGCCCGGPTTGSPSRSATRAVASPTRARRVPPRRPRRRPAAAGLWIARSLCDRVAIEAGPTGTVVTVSLQCSRPSPARRSARAVDSPDQPRPARPGAESRPGGGAHVRVKPGGGCVGYLAAPAIGTRT